MIPLKIHNIIDYVLGTLLIATPWIFDFSAVHSARNSLVILGLLLIAYSLATNYYYSLAKAIPLGVHMALDAVIGIAMILAPSFLGYREYLTEGQYAVQIVLGVFTVGLVALTRPRTEDAKTPRERAAIHSHDARRL